MKSFFEYIQLFGSSSADTIWFPILIWTAVASITFLALRFSKSLNPLYQYHIRVATLLALPMGLVSALLLQMYSSFTTSSNFDGSIFIVENPLPAIYTSVNQATVEATINWFDVNFIIGIVTSVSVIVASLLIIKLIVSYSHLRKLHKSLSTEELTNTQFISGIKDGYVSVAFHSHPLVPFTFGWKKPIIVLPEKIKNDAEKLDMAIQHELVHIRRGDYLLQLTLSVIESLFWFHPIIHIGSKEIETFREISCDQEVLNTSNVQPKKYANLLLELLPLNKEYGSFTVSMAVKKSTLKQRIETMKHHKMHKTSYKQSLLLLLSMTLMVVAPIACSDLRGTEALSDQEVLDEKITLTEFKVDINGTEVLNADEPGAGVSTQGLGAIAISPKNYGLFEFSIRPFDGAVQVGSISNDIAEFKINELNVSIKSSKKILENNMNALLWVRHFPNANVKAGFSAYADANVPPPPPPRAPVPHDEEVFIVVESMPELVGGQAGVQSKVEYPQQAIDKGIEGRVTVQFIVDENGDVVNPKVIRGIGGGCDEEALRVVSQAKFKPGVQRGRNVAVQMSLPILFRLSNSEFKQSENPLPPQPVKKSNN